MVVLFVAETYVHGKGDGTYVPVSFQLLAGRAGQSLGNGQPHAVADAEMTGGIRSHAAGEWGISVESLKSRNICQNGLEFPAAGLCFVAAVTVEALKHAAQNALEKHDVALVESNLQIVDFFQMFKVSVMPFLDVEQFQMRDEALSVPENLQNVLRGKAGQLQGNAVTAAQRCQSFQKLRNSETEKNGTRIVRGDGRLVGRGKLRIADRGKTAVMNDRRREFVHAFHASQQLFPSGVVCLFEFHGKIGDFVLEFRKKCFMRKFRKMQQRGLSVSHKGQKGIGIQHGHGNAEISCERGRVSFVPQHKCVHDVLPEPLRGLSTFVEKGLYGI